MLTSKLQLTNVVFSAPQFYCPSCHTHRPYELKKASDAKIICFLPIYHASEHSRVIECQVCRNSFDPAIMHPSNKMLFKLVAATRAQLLTGTTPGSLKAQLLSDGLKEEFIDRLIGLAQG